MLAFVVDVSRGRSRDDPKTKKQKREKVTREMFPKIAVALNQDSKNAHSTFTACIDNVFAPFECMNCRVVHKNQQYELVSTESVQREPKTKIA